MKFFLQQDKNEKKEEGNEYLRSGHIQCGGKKNC